MRKGTSHTRRPGDAGFTLIEIMVVVVILAVLATLVAPKIMSRPGEARLVKAKQDILALEAALNLYKLDNHIYPTTDQGLDALVKKPTQEPLPPNWREGGYLARPPKDPWGRAYLYLRPGAHGEFDLYTLGADGVEGGEDVNADIGNWNLEGGQREPGRR
ncbi:Type II secretion system protein G [Candidatus Magnetaquicoccaceae bacterium FCR-1]|uniref:Type II secretion system core protein G n=1 Tax=Candidatus Magnetaquiglobus chichijimensis TaxID=3141448 RepID=A0ABQ0C5S6_9PROT